MIKRRNDVLQVIVWKNPPALRQVFIDKDQMKCYNARNSYFKAKAMTKKAEIGRFQRVGIGCEPIAKNFSGLSLLSWRCRKRKQVEPPVKLRKSDGLIGALEVALSGAI